MSTGNTVTLVGNITRDPELRQTRAAPVASFGLAVNRRWSDSNGEWQEATSFFDVTCWKELAENVASSLPKGARVMVTGRLEQQSWESDGQRRYKVHVVADDVGPSLRWATASVEKNERESVGTGSSRPPSAGHEAPF